MIKKDYVSYFRPAFNKLVAKCFYLFVFVVEKPGVSFSIFFLHFLYLSFGVLFQRRDYGLGNVVGEPLQLSVDVSRGLRGGLYPLLHDVLLVLLGQKVDRLLGELAPGVAAARGRGEGFLRPRVLVAPAGRWGRLWGLRSHGSFLIVPAQIHFSPFHGRGFGRQVIHRSMDSFLPVERVHSTNVRKPSGVDVGA